MRLAGKNKRRQFLEEAKKWFKTHTETALFFGGEKDTAIRSVAEYMANKEGLTLYDRK